MLNSKQKRPERGIINMGYQITRKQKPTDMYFLEWDSNHRAKKNKAALTAFYCFDIT